MTFTIYNCKLNLYYSYQWKGNNRCELTSLNLPRTTLSTFGYKINNFSVIKSLINQQQHTFQSKFVSFYNFTNVIKQHTQTVMCAEHNVVSVSC